MADFIRSILRTNAAIAADGDIVYDLPVNPLSAILLHISPLNESSTITTYRYMQELLGALVNVRVTHKGTSVVDASGADLGALALLYHRMSLWQSGQMETDNFRRSLVLPILFGRRAFHPTECFPETRKGELQLTCTYDIAATAFDGLRMSIETIELPDASPEFVQKVTTNSSTFAATGQNDVELPIGNMIRAILLWGTTGFTGATPAPTLGQLSVFKDNRQIGFTATDWEVLRGDFGLRGIPYPPDGRHIHSGTYTTTVAGDSREPEVGAALDHLYAMLDFDPLQDDTYILDTAGAGRVHVRSDAEAAEAVRVLPIERVAVAEFTD